MVVLPERFGWQVYSTVPLRDMPEYLQVRFYYLLEVEGQATAYRNEQARKRRARGQGRGGGVSVGIDQIPEEA